MQWTDEEAAQIRDTQGERNRARERQRLMHNRTADEKGHHKINRYGGDNKIWCAKCGQNRNANRMTQWPKTICHGKAETGMNEAEGNGNIKKKNIGGKRKKEKERDETKEAKGEKKQSNGIRRREEKKEKDAAKATRKKDEKEKNSRSKGSKNKKTTGGKTKQAQKNNKGQPQDKAKDTKRNREENDEKRRIRTKQKKRGSNDEGKRQSKRRKEE